LPFVVFGNKTLPAEASPSYCNAATALNDSLHWHSP